LLAWNFSEKNHDAPTNDTKAPKAIEKLPAQFRLVHLVGSRRRQELIVQKTSTVRFKQELDEEALLIRG
jgi:hypothetical protein